MYTDYSREVDLHTCHYKSHEYTEHLAGIRFHLSCKCEPLGSFVDQSQRCTGKEEEVGEEEQGEKKGEGGGQGRGGERQ